MVDAIRKPPIKTPGAPAAPNARKPAAGEDQPAIARTGLVVSDAARLRAEKAKLALDVINRDDPNAPKATTTPVELGSTDKRSATWSSPTQQAAARGELMANRPAEKAALTALGPAKAATYDAVRAKILHDPTAERALQAMLLDGRLTAMDGVGQGDMLAHLSQIARQKNVHGVQPKELLRTLVRELHTPESISQGDGDIGTCVATTATILAATTQPAEIARLVAGLAAEKGEVRMRPVPPETVGPVLTRTSNWNKDTKGFGGDRSPAVRLLQPALMDYALRTKLDAKQAELAAAGVKPGDVAVTYDPRSDAWTPSAGPDAAANGGVDIAVWKELNAGGLDTEQGNRLIEHLSGERHEPLSIHDGNREAAFARVIDAVRGGRMVPIGIDYTEKQDDGTWHGGGHQMMIRNVDAKGVHVIDPIEGTHHVWSLEKVKGAITDANLPR